MNSFSTKLRSIMTDKKMTAEKIAKLMGVSTSTVTHWSNGRRFPKNEELIKSLSEALNVNITDFFDDEMPLKTIPLIGIASCGVPNLTYSDTVEHIPVPADLARDGVYAVQADGDSMLTKIANGDIVICDKEMPCEHGNIVHYTTVDGESGLKKYLIDDKGVVTLMPLNSDFQPIMCDEKDLRCARAFKILADL